MEIEQLRAKTAAAELFDRQALTEIGQEET